MKGKKYLLPLLSATLICSLVACSESEEENTYVPQGAGPNSGASQSTNYNSSGTNTSSGSVSSGATSTTGSVEESGSFSAESAKTEVLRHSGYTENMIQGYECEFVEDKGVQTYYISFWMGFVHYTYQVSGVDGTIIAFHSEFNHAGYTPPSTEEETTTEVQVFTVQPGHVTKDQAKAIAAKDAGVSTSSMSNFEIANRTTGNINEYEMTFKVGDVEYYYTMLPTTGTITLSRKTEPEPEPEPEIPVVTTPSVTVIPSTGNTSSGSSSGSASTGTDSVVTTPSEPEVTLPEPTVTETPEGAISSSSSSSSVTDESIGTQSNTASSSTGATNSSSATHSSVTTSTSGAVSAPVISSNDAKNIAFAQAGVSESDVSSLSILEAKDGTGAVAAYNVSFISGGGSHYYTVSATTGAVR